MTTINNKTLPVILSGGEGVRLWPASNPKTPKQFLKLSQSKTLFDNTIETIQASLSFEELIVSGSIYHTHTIRKHISNYPFKKTVIAEPSKKNTAAAIITSALYTQNIDKNAISIVFPCDHYIKNLNHLKETLNTAILLAKNKKIVAIGVEPSYPESGYGYIKKGAACEGGFEIDQFIEKPSKHQAEKLLLESDYLWNAGIFVFEAATLIEYCNEINPKIVDACSQALTKATSLDNVIQLSSEHYELNENISFDKALMENIQNRATVELKCAWSDLGNWESLRKMNRNEDGNLIVGNTLTVNTKNSVVYGESGLVSTFGVNDMVVVESAGNMLVMPKKNATELHAFIEILKSKDSHKNKINDISKRPWGSYKIIDSGEGFQVKRITVNGHQSISLQFHNHRMEHWFVVNGTGIVTLGDNQVTIKKGMSVNIEKKQVHRIRNTGSETLIFIEVQMGSYLEEDDIVRLEDDYNRIKKIK